MEYSINALSKLAGVTTRTLRYYDQIGLLPPLRKAESGYRVYGSKEAARLQEILFYRELGFPLSVTADLLADPAFDRMDALEGHKRALLEQRARLDTLISTVEKTILAEEGKIQMTDQERFKGFQKEQIDKNEAAYGEELRRRYGEKKVAESNRKYMGLSQEALNEMETLGEEILSRLSAAVQASQSPDGEEGRRIAQLHKKWLSYTWESYSKEAHTGLAQMYVADERFTAYYDKETSGCAQFLCDAICAYAV